MEACDGPSMAEIHRCPARATHFCFVAEAETGASWIGANADHPFGRVAAAPELAATRRPLREAKRQPLTEDCDVRPRDCVPTQRPRPCLLEIDGSANGDDRRRA